MSTFFVDRDALSDGDGSSWELAYQSLAAALNTAQTGDEIWVAEGIYFPGTERSDAFEINAGVTIYGGFDGTEDSLIDRDWQQNLTILSGDIGTPDERSDNSYHVVFSDTDAVAELNGVTVQGGNTEGSDGSDDGGGIYNRQRLTIQNTIVRDNRSIDDGGGIRNDGELLVINSAIANNSAVGSSSLVSGGGGLINTVNAAATIINTTFSGNQALNGGAIRNDGELSLTNTTISDNTGDQSGGGILNTNSSGTAASIDLANSTVTQNLAPSSAGIFNFGFIAASNSIIADNQNDTDFTDNGLLGGSSRSDGYNLIGNGSNAVGFTSSANNDQVGTSTNPIDPLLGDLQDNGGFTQTHLPTENSPAIDSGSNSLLPDDSEDLDSDGDSDEALSTDQRGAGFDRVFNETVDIGAVEVGAAPPPITNEPPSVAIGPVVTSLSENIDTSQAIKLANVIVTDADEIGINTLTIVTTNPSIFEVIDDELFLKAGSSLDFETQSQYNITLQVDDATVGSTPDAAVNFRLLITDVNDNDIGVLEVSANQLLNAVIKTGLNGQLGISVDTLDTSQLSEVVVVSTDDVGRVNGIAPGEEGYLDALIAESLSLLSTLEKGTFEGLDVSRQVALEADGFLQFGVITGGTLDSLRRNGIGTFQIGPSLTEALEGTDDGILQVQPLGDGKVRLGFDIDGDSDFEDLVLTASLQAASEVIGAGLQGGQESELIDLRSVSGPVTADITVYREAAFDNVLGFFTVENEDGQVRDQAGNLLNVGDAGYVKAAIENRVTPDLTGKNNTVTTYSTQIAGGQLLSSFIVSDGAIADLLDENLANDPAVYFTHLGANSDGADHVRLLGDNTFGFEDMLNGGDQDFDDLVVKVTLSV